jgi:DNA-binding transcriptional LysR family regulator
MLKRAQLRHFIALAEAGGFTAAARRLNLTQPTLSASVTELERLLGTSLILRSRGGGRRELRLTDAGHRLLVQARSIEKSFKAAETELVTGHIPVRPLTLGILASLSTALVAEVRARFGEQRPLVLIEGTDADLRRRLRERQIDGALTLLRNGEADEPCLEEPYAVLLSSRHPMADRVELEAEELAGEAMIARRSCELLAETSKFFTTRGVRPHFLMRSASDDRCLAFVRAGFAITTGPVSLAGQGVVPVPLQGYTYRRSIGLLMPDREGREALTAAWVSSLVAFHG